LATHDGFQSGRTVALTLTIGSGGTLVLGIQPLLLETFLSGGRLNASELGWVATSEVLGIALGILLGARVLSEAGQLKLAVAGLLMALANLMTLAASRPELILAARGLAGLAEGVLVAVAVLSISYGRSPGRLNAAFLTIGAAPQILLAYLIPAELAPRFGPNIGFEILAAVGLACSVMALYVRDRFAPETTRSTRGIAWTPTVVLVLVATLLTAAAIGACWSYLGPMGAALGLNQEQTGVAVSIATTCALVGSLFVAVVGWRLSFRVALLGGTILQITAVMWVLRAQGPVEFYVALGLFGFLWQALVPFAMDLMVSVDSSRATAPLVLPLNIAGLSVGPLVASCCVEHSVVGAFRVALLGFVAALVAYWIIFRDQRVVQVRLGH
jgi:MFS transporter, DHA1 family, inner membrane transport protein